METKGGKIRKKIVGAAASFGLAAPLIFIVYSVHTVIKYKKENPLYIKKGENFKNAKQLWMNLDEIPIQMMELVVLKEDSNFFFHKGVVFNQLLDGFICYVLNGFKPSFGFSTISQQTAKIIFLYHDRTILRKILEVYYASLIELFWGKERILEVYLNSVEVGKDLYGLETGAFHFFSRTLSDLTLDEKGLLACCLTNPHINKVDQPSENFKHGCSNFLDFYEHLVSIKEKRR